MGRPGYGTDPVDREFDNLLRAARQAPGRRLTTSGTDDSRNGGGRTASDTVSVSDAQFESLLTAFKSLNDSRGAVGATRTVDSRDGGGTTPRMGEVEQRMEQLPRATAAPGIPASRGTCASCISPGAVADDSRDGGGRATPGAVADEPGAPPPLPADSRAATAATQLSRAWRGFASHPAIGQNPDLQQAVRRLECSTINLQLALPGTAAQAVLVVGVAGQSFVLAAAQVVEVLDVEPASLAHDGQRACIVTGAERLPLYFLRDWLVHGGLDETMRGNSRVVVVAVAGGRAGIVVDAVDVILTVAVRPLGALLRGTPGLKGMAMADERALPLLDLAVLLGDAARGRAGYGAGDAEAQN